MELVGYTNQAYVVENENGKPPEQPDGVEPPQKTASTGWVGTVQVSVGAFYMNHRSRLVLAIKLCILLLYFVFVGFAFRHRFGDEGSMRLLVCTIIGVILLIVHLLAAPVKKRFCSSWPRRTSKSSQKARKILRWALFVLMAAFIIVWTIVDVGLRDTRNLMSLSGILFFVVTLYVTSHDPANVNWHPVFWGMAMQYVFALLIIRTQWGYDAFDWLGDRITEWLSYSDAGAVFIFGEKYTDHFFAFKVLPVIVYFSAVISVLYYLGVMRVVIGVLGRFLAFCMDTSATESLNAAGNIFIGQTEAPLMIRPFLERMTKSEIHAVMTGGFATVAGSVLGAYVAYDIKASYLLGASVMSAPAALAMSKLTYPETESTDINEDEVYKGQSGSTRNVIEAISVGASTAIKLVANIAVNLIAFLSILEFINATLVWCGDRVGVEGFTFEFICSYVFYPMAFLMGVDETDCRRVARLIGYKTFTNEFIAYIEMGKLLKNGNLYSNYTTTLGNDTGIVHDGLDIILPDWNNTVLAGGILTARSEVIATYALCGFSNLGSVGIQLGAFSAMAPTRKTDLSRLVLRAMIAGNVACFMTACIAGLFYEER